MRTSGRHLSPAPAYPLKGGDFLRLRITDWDKHFENAASRKLKRLDWVAIPNKTDGEGYTALVDHPNAAAHLGAWYAIVEIASKQSPRGVLPGGICQHCGGICRRSGTKCQPLGGICRSLSRMSRLPSEVFEEVLPRLIEIGWVEDIEKSEVSLNQQNVRDLLGESANVVGGSADVVGESGRLVAAQGIELQGITEEKNICPPNGGRLFDLASSNGAGAGKHAPGWFEEWWAIYWRRVSRKLAEQAFAKCVKTQAQFDRVMAATRKQTPAMMAREPDKRPHGATWLNGERWNDEPSEPALAPQRSNKCTTQELAGLIGAFRQAQ